MMFTIVHEYFQSPSNNICMNRSRVLPPLWQNMQLQNEFPNSYFVTMLDWERGITLNHGNRRWATA